MNEVDTIIGKHAAIAVLQNPNREILSLKCTKDFYEKNKELIKNKKIQNFNIVKRKLIESETGNDFHQGIIIKTRSLRPNDLNSIKNSEEIIVVLDSLNDSQNVGSILRTVYLFGVKTVIYNKDNSFQQNYLLFKSACGAFEKIKCIQVINLSRAIEILKKKGFWILGLDLNSKNNIQNIPKDLKKALVFGSESKGIRKFIIKNCDFTAKIELPSNDKSIDSLNVSNSVSVALYECLRK